MVIRGDIKVAPNNYVFERTAPSDLVALSRLINKGISSTAESRRRSIALLDGSKALDFVSLKFERCREQTSFQKNLFPERRWTMKDLRICISASIFLLALNLALAPILWAQARIPAKDSSSQVELDSLIETAMMQWEVPGLAVVVVKGGETVLLEGYGTRILGESLDVDADTYL